MQSCDLTAPNPNGMLTETFYLFLCSQDRPIKCDICEKNIDLVHKHRSILLHYYIDVFIGNDNKALVYVALDMG